MGLLKAEIDEFVLKQVGIDSKVAVFEIDFAKLVELATEERIYSPPSKFPTTSFVSMSDCVECLGQLIMTR